MKTTHFTCNCGCTPQPEQSTIKKTFSWTKPFRSLPSVLLSLIIAFFPKCPVCWAVYMSALSNIGLSEIPYYSWLYPVLLLLLGFHLLLLYRNIRKNGYIPFVLSIGGTICLLSFRMAFPTEKWLLYGGMSFMILSSLLNSYYQYRVQKVVPENIYPVNK